MFHPGAGRESFAIALAVQGDQHPRCGFQQAAEIVKLYRQTFRQRWQTKLLAHAIIKKWRQRGLTGQVFVQRAGDNERIEPVETAFREAHELHAGAVQGRMETASLQFTMQPMTEFRPIQAQWCVR